MVEMEGGWVKVVDALSGTGEDEVGRTETGTVEALAGMACMRRFALVWFSRETAGGGSEALQRTDVL